MSRTFILGWNGYVGKIILEGLRNKNISAVKVGRNENSDIKIDLNSLDSNKLESLLPGDKFIFLSGICNPNVCNESYDLAYAVNVTNTKILLQEVLDRGLKVLFASSDVVYGDTDIVVNEKSQINPCFPYAEMKAEIEISFSTHPNFFVMRMSNIASLNDNTLSYLFACSKDNSKASIYHPFIRTPAYANDLTDFVCNFIESESSIFQKLVNICGPSFVSNINLAKIFSNNLSLNYEIATPSKAFLDSRPQKILMQSLYLDKIIKRNTINMCDQLNLDLSSL